ncbi:hypothetical protein LCGC14_1765030 [marine sediment metagenome]|uniref:Uncharacterized protein n=1 Tax=marine sediment metagenome TaxID=412755 RepID=A0A0F9JEW2_9ZZZZ
MLVGQEDRLSSIRLQTHIHIPVLTVASVLTVGGVIGLILGLYLVVPLTGIYRPLFGVIQHTDVW